jgi:hypothetical protein
MRMANEVMKAAHDELSLRGRGDDFVEDYNPNSDDPMNNVYTFTGR